MSITQGFFKPQQEKIVHHTTCTPSSIHINGQADYAVSILLIDYLLTPMLQKKQRLTDVFLKPLLKTLDEDCSLEMLCSKTDPNKLVPAFADINNQVTLDYLLKHSRSYTSAFLSTSPHTLSSEQLQQNPKCLNPWMPSVMSRLLDFPFHITETTTNKTLQKKYPSSGFATPASTGIKLLWTADQCFVPAQIQFKSHFKNLDKTCFPPRKLLQLNGLEQQIQHISHEASRSEEAYNTAKQKLEKYFITEKTSTSNIRDIYLDYLNKSKHLESPSGYFDTLHGTQNLFQHVPPKNPIIAPVTNTFSDTLRNDLIAALARLVILNERLDIYPEHTEKTTTVFMP